MMSTIAPTVLSVSLRPNREINATHPHRQISQKLSKLNVVDSMTLTKKHIAFYDKCRLIFIGKIIRGVSYIELQYFTPEGNINIKPQPFYKTKHPDTDSVDLSIHFRTDDLTIHVFWDDTFTCYGLSTKEVNPSTETNHYVQEWNVSSENKWKEIIGQKIIDFNILWGEILSGEDFSSGTDQSNKEFVVYPQAFKIKTEYGATIILAAAEFADAETEKINSPMDNILITTNADLAKRLKLIK